MLFAWFREFVDWTSDELAYENSMLPGDKFIYGAGKGQTSTMASLIASMMYNGTDKCQITSISLLSQLVPWIREAGLKEPEAIRAASPWPPLAVRTLEPQGSQGLAALMASGSFVPAKGFEAMALRISI